jgi:hypothetical protein
LDIHDDQARHEFACPIERLMPIGDGFDRKALALQDIAKQFPVEIVVLDNEDSLCHFAPIVQLAPELMLYAFGKSLTILRDRSSPVPDSQALALAALGWLLESESRAQRLLALTGLTPDELRGGLGDPAQLGAVLEFLCAHQPDLLAAAEALGVKPQELVAARESLSS